MVKRCTRVLCATVHPPTKGVFVLVVNSGIILTLPWCPNIRTTQNMTKKYRANKIVLCAFIRYDTGSTGAHETHIHVYIFKISLKQKGVNIPAV